MSDSKYWFPAKSQGWGWGRPCRWQGWLVIALIVGAIIPVVILTEPYTPAWFESLFAIWAFWWLIALAKGDPKGRPWRNRERA